MQKIKAKIITALLLAALSLTLIPLAFASSGVIIINSTSGIQPLPVASVPAGGNVTLYFGNVTFSGSQFYLLFSADGLSQVSSGDLRYTPIFNVAAVMDTTSAPAVLSDPLYPGQWTVGQGWVNGTIPQNIPGGTFYIKAFDGAVAALAVTQGIPVIASLNIIPNAGGAGRSIIVSANAFPANSLVNFTYVDNDTLTIVHFANLVATNSLGQVNITMPAPDVMKAPGAGLQPITNTLYTFTAQQNGTSTTIYNATYTEAQRGLIQIGKPSSAFYFNATTGNVFGNMSRFDLTPTAGLSTISVGVGNTVRIAGINFYPGVVTTRWDNSIDVAPTGNTASATGSFNETFTVPVTGLGSHNITLIDANLQVFVVFVNVVQSITISPTSGPIGTTVTVTGYGFPSSGVPAGNVYNATITFSFGSPTVRAWALTDANGQFTTTFVVPSGAAGGANEVRATTNDTSGTFANATFTVTANFILVARNTVDPLTVVNATNPTIFYANSSNTVVAASGTGFTASSAYFVAIDNVFSPFTNTTNGVMASSSGVLNFTFIGVGFQAGLHVVAIYATGSGSGANTPTANATFTVLGGNVAITSDVLTAINDTVTKINSTVTLNSQTLAAINASVVAITGNVATLATSIGNLTISVNAIGANVTSIKGTVATIQTSVGTLQTTVSAINANITGVNNGFATVQTSLGTLTTTVNSLGSTLTSVSGTVGTISTTVGSISTDLSSIGTKVTSIQGTVATIQTDLGTLTGTVTSIQGNVATIQTNIGTLQASVDNVKTDVDNVPSQVNIPIWIAVVLALIAAIAAIASLLLVRRKIAG